MTGYIQELIEKWLTRNEVEIPKVEVDSSDLPDGAATEATLAAVQAAVETLDDIVSGDAAKVIVGTTTAVPGPAPRPSSPRCKAAVPELRARAPPTPTRAATSASNASTCGPSGATQPERSASTTNSSSTPVTSGDESRMGSLADRSSAAAGVFCSAGNRGVLEVVGLGT